MIHCTHVCTLVLSAFAVKASGSEQLEWHSWERAVILAKSRSTVRDDTLHIECIAALNTSESEQFDRFVSLCCLPPDTWVETPSVALSAAIYFL